MARERLISLDVFRGFTILLMTIVNNPGDWGNVYSPFLHSDWHGCTPTDLVFPFFVFIMGVAVSFAMPTKTFDSATFSKIVARSLRMVCLGIFFNFFSKIQFLGLEGVPLLLFRLLITAGVGYALMGNFSTKIKNILAFFIFVIYIFLAYSGIEAYQDVRLPGVLQRIGIVYFVVTLLYLKTNIKTQIAVTTLILLGYWGIMTLIPVPGVGEANLEIGTNLAAWVDNLLLKGHMYQHTLTWDPEGILSTIPSIATGLIGMLIGQILHLAIPKTEKAKKITFIAVGLIILGLLWNIIFPINKSLWTSSFVVYTAGIASFCLGLLYYLIDITEFKKGTKLFLIWGVNPMIVFFLSQIIPQAIVMISVQNPAITGEQMDLKSYLYNYGVVPFFSNPKAASLADAILYVFIWTLLLWFFYKKKWFFKV